MDARKSESDQAVELEVEQEQDPAQGLARVVLVRVREPRARGAVLIQRQSQVLHLVRVAALELGPQALLDRALVYRSRVGRVAMEIS
jgi:hypothetical protein